MSDRNEIVTSVCAAFRTWGKVTDNNRWPTEFEAYKSNLLYRLIYLGEPLREVKCPKHDGHWSGCKWRDYCDCQKVINPDDGLVYYDSNVTGWLLADNPPITGQCQSISLHYDGKRQEVPMGCTQLSGHKGACDHGHDWNM